MVRKDVFDIKGAFMPPLSYEVKGAAPLLRSILDDHNDEKLVVLRVKERFTSPSNGGWSDVLVNMCFGKHAAFPSEIQFVHAKMLVLRHDLGGHQIYACYRAAVEILELHAIVEDTAKDKSIAVGDDLYTWTILDKISAQRGVV